MVKIRVEEFLNEDYENIEVVICEDEVTLWDRDKSTGNRYIFSMTHECFGDLIKIYEKYNKAVGLVKSGGSND